MYVLVVCKDRIKGLCVVRSGVLHFLFVCVMFVPSLFCGLVPAKYAGEFLATGVGARPLGMGGAFVAAAEDVTSIYWNPAGLVSMTTFQIHGMHAERFAGIVNWDFIGLGLPFGDDLALGFGFFRLGVDGIPLTDLKDPSRDLGEIYVDASGRRVRNVPFAYDYINDSEMAFVFSFARARSGWCSYGGNVKVIRKNAGEYKAWGVGFDFGLSLNLFDSLKMGIVLVDGTSTLVAWSGGRKELIIPHLKTGVAYPFRFSRFDILPVFDVHINFENQGSATQVALGRLGLDFRGGLEVGFKERVAVRTGIDRGRLTVGAGLRIRGVGIDYGFLPHLDLGNTHRVSITFSRKN